jgi:hypothetical protein
VSRQRHNPIPLLRGDCLPRIYDADCPAGELVASAAAWAGVTITPEAWRAERSRMRLAGSREAYYRVKRTGATFRVDRCARDRMWQIANDLRETPNPGTISDFRRYEPGQRSLFE